MTLNLRSITPTDKQAVLEVEAQATPNLRYLPYVFDSFVADEQGDFFLAEADDKVVGCAKFTVLANQSAWLETLRVIPDYQGCGIGKQLYQRFFDIAKREGIDTMRMYTGSNNVVSKGLAEHVGFQLEETFSEYSLSCDANSPRSQDLAFKQVQDPLSAVDLMMAQAPSWRDFVVMNRTFYKLSVDLCVDLAQQGQVYEHAESKSVMVLGSRFMVHEALHLAMFAGDEDLCLAFAEQQALERSSKQLCCMLPITAKDNQDVLVTHGFQVNPSSFIVMKV